MKFALVTFAFCGNTQLKKQYLVKTDLLDLTSGDMVYIEGDSSKEKYVTCFVRYVEYDKFPSLKRRMIIERVPGTELNKIAKEQLKKFEHLWITEKACKGYKKKFKDNIHFTNDEAKKKILRNLCVASKVKTNIKGYEFYAFGTMLIVIQNNSSIVKVKNSNVGIRWTRPELTVVLDNILFATDFVEFYVEHHQMVNV